MDIMVSVYCFAYNQEQYIRDALEGFVKQKTSFLYEVIVHDDASTDQTADIIREYAEKYPDIIKPIFQTDNQYSKGTKMLREFILPVMKGRYIACCEGDDYWIDENKLQKQYDFMEQHPDCSLVVHWSKILYSDTGVIKDFAEYDQSCHEPYILETEKILKRHLLFTTNSMFYRREHYEINREIDEKVRRFDYVTKSLLATEGTVYVIPVYMSVYRFGSIGSWTRTVKRDPEKKIAHLEESIRFYKLLKAHCRNLYDNTIDDVIHRRQFEILLERRDFRGMKSPEFYADYKKFSCIQRAAFHFSACFPQFYDFMRYKVKTMVQRLIHKAMRK